MRRVRRGAGPQKTEGKSDLAAGRAGQKLAKRDKIGIARLVDPLPAQNQLVAEVTEMGDRTAKRGQPESQKDAENFSDRAGLEGVAAFALNGWHCC